MFNLFQLLYPSYNCYKVFWKFLASIENCLDAIGNLGVFVCLSALNSAGMVFFSSWYSLKR